MTKLLYALIVLILPVELLAQPNLVSNGNFENYTTCPSSFSQVGNSTGWLSWNTSGSPDYYNTCATGGPMIPTSVVGYQWPASGNAYMGIFNSSIPNIVKEYITRPIPALQVGMIYEISMSVSLANFSSGGTNDLAVYFYDAGPSSYAGIGIAPVSPKVDWTNITIIDTQNWVRLSKTFIADSAYDNIAIGGSLGTSTVNYVPVTANSGITYYLIDSVVLKVYDSLSFVFTDSLKCSGDTLQINYISSKKKQSSNTFTLQLSSACTLYR